MVAALLELLVCNGKHKQHPELTKLEEKLYAFTIHARCDTLSFSAYIPLDIVGDAVYSDSYLPGVMLSDIVYFSNSRRSLKKQRMCEFYMC